MAWAVLLIHPSHTAFTSITMDASNIDASNIAMGGALEQFLDGEWKPVAFFSKKLNPIQARYSAFDWSCWRCTWLRNISCPLSRGIHSYWRTTKHLLMPSTTHPQNTQLIISAISHMSELSTDIRHTMWPWTHSPESSLMNKATNSQTVHHHLNCLQFSRLWLISAR